jgi:hypothetical protein
MNARRNIAPPPKIAILGRNQCIFCNRIEKLTKEHIWPQWVSDYIAISPTAHTRACHQLSQTTLATSWTAARKFRLVFS